MGFYSFCVFGFVISICLYWFILISIIFFTFINTVFQLILIEWFMHKNLALCSAGVATASGKRKERACIDRHDCCSSNWEGETSNPAGNPVLCVRAHIPGSVVYMYTEGKARTFLCVEGVTVKNKSICPSATRSRDTSPRNDRWWSVEGV